MALMRCPSIDFAHTLGAAAGDSVSGKAAGVLRTYGTMTASRLEFSGFNSQCPQHLTPPHA